MATKLYLAHQRPRVANLVSMQFNDTPNLKNFLTACLLRFDEKSVAEQIDEATYRATLCHLRVELTRQFGALVGTDMQLRDINAGYARDILARYGLHTVQARERFTQDVDSRALPKFWLFYEMAKRALMNHLAAVSCDVEHARDRDRLGYIAFLAWMASSPRRPAVVGNTATHLGALVDRLFADATTPPTQRAPLLQIAGPVPRLCLVVDND